MLMPTDKEIANFWKRVTKTDYCWIWIGAKSKDKGYGYCTINGKSRLAHRVSWLMHYGTISNELDLLHVVCDNPACVNPAHLKPGTHLDNMRDMDKKHRGNRVGIDGFHTGRTLANLHPGEIWLIHKLRSHAVYQHIVAKMFRLCRQTITRLETDPKYAYLRVPSLPPSSGKFKLSDAQVVEVKKLCKEGKTRQFIATVFHVSPALVTIIDQGKHRANI